jgi:hypothetical protein
LSQSLRADRSPKATERTQVTVAAAGDSGAIAQVEGLVARGEYLLAYDAISGFERGDVSANAEARLDYLRILCLARSGAAERAGA